MATIIDTLIVKLGLDPKDLNSKSGEYDKKLKSLEGSTKKVTSANKDAGRGFEDLGRKVASFLAIVGGTYAIKAFVMDTINANAALDRFSKNIGLNVSTVSAWGNAVEEFGGSAKNLQGTMDMLSKQQSQLRLTGESSLIPYFARLGINIGAFGQKVRPVDEILLDLSERFSHMDRTQANNMGRMMGIDQDTLNLLLQGREAVELMIKRQKEHNAVTKQEAEQAAKWQRSIVQLNQTFNKFGRDLLQMAAPAIEKVIAWLTKASDWVTKNSEVVKDFLTIIAVGIAAISAAMMANEIGLITAGVLALAGAVSLLWQDYQTWKRGGNSFVDWQVWKDRVDAVKQAVEHLREELQKLSKFTKLFDLIPGVKKLDNWMNPSDDEKKGTLRKFFGVNTPGGHTQVSKSALAIGQIEGFNAKGSKPNRPQRNHNPGDIEYGSFAKNHGAVGSDGRFAIFPDEATGYRALDALLRTKEYAGLTVAQAITKFAPPKENDTAKYIRDFSARTGLQANDNINGSAADGIRGAASTVAQASGGAGHTSNDNSKSVQTGDINIFTKATDAQGIANDMNKSLNYLFVSQANGGLS